MDATRIQELLDQKKAITEQLSLIAEEGFQRLKIIAEMILARSKEFNEENPHHTECVFTPSPWLDDYGMEEIADARIKRYDIFPNEIRITFEWYVGSNRFVNADGRIKISEVSMPIQDFEQSIRLWLRDREDEWKKDQEAEVETLERFEMKCLQERFGSDERTARERLAELQAKYK